MSEEKPEYMKESWQGGFQLPKRIAVVTGGARGIGRAIVEELLQQRFHVVFLDYSIGEDAIAFAKDVNEKASAYKATPLSYEKLDVTDGAAAQAAIDKIVAEHG
ncbi:MAG: SDR family NAD(P)-dependent oxidoreductase, partial [Candidatus Kapaibacterium sp.]